MMLLGGIFVGVALLSLVLTGILRRYALTRRMLDIPNERSSHSVPTPRGGGAAIVLGCLPALLLLGGLDRLPAADVLAFVGAGSLVALVGWLDDHGHVAARWRLLAHFVSAVWALAWLGGLPPVSLLGATFDFAWFGHGLAALYLIWLLNLYNFMDGIDGIAGIEGLTVCLGGVLLYLLVPENGSDWVAPMVLLSAVLGFLCWNFPNARIFMGDAGSGFVGIMLGLLSLQSAWVAPELLWGWVILLGVFIVDATVTLLRRALRGERVYEAHRSHAYQYASRRFGTHTPVSIAVGLINLFWLLPIAMMVALGRLEGLAGVTLAYLPLVWLVLHFHAGTREAQRM